MSDVYKPYWYFRFKEGYFDNPKVLAMERVPIYGEKMSLTLLKLYDKAISTGGKITFEYMVSEDSYVSYLADMVRVDFKFMGAAMSYYLEHDFISLEEDENGKVIICLPYVEENTGKSSDKADRERRRVSRIKNSARKELVHEQENLPEPKEEIKNVYGEFKNVKLSDEEYLKIKGRYVNADELIERLSEYYAKFPDRRYENDYAAILSFGRKDGIRKKEKSDSEAYIQRLRFEAGIGCPPPEAAKEVIGEEVWNEIKAIADIELKRSGKM